MLVYGWIFVLIVMGLFRPDEEIAVWGAVCLFVGVALTLHLYMRPPR